MDNFPQVLVVEDDLPILLALEKVLEEEGYSVRTASTSSQALKMLAFEAPPRIILLDVHLPDLDGRECLRKIKTNAVLSQIPVIGMSALKFDSSVKNLFDGWMDKPVNIDNLISLVKDASGRRGTSAPTARLRGDPYIGLELGRCRIEVLLGRGGMARVYRARQLDVDRTVAVKIFAPASDFDENAALGRLRREAKMISRINHPNVVQLYFMGEEGPLKYLVFEYVEGWTLSNRILEANALPVSEAADLAYQVAQGLVAAHALSVIHRDIKPDNILITADGYAKIADFGLAREAADSLDLTKPNEAVGTPFYMSPEQAQGKSLDGRTDVYSLGLTLWSALTGEKPFQGDSAFTILYQQVNDPLPPLRKVRPDAPEEIERLVTWMTAKSAEDRPNSEEVLEVLKPYAIHRSH